jgi:hypothetical protein
MPPLRPSSLDMSHSWSLDLESSPSLPPLSPSQPDSLLLRAVFPLPLHSTLSFTTVTLPQRLSYLSITTVSACIRQSFRSISRSVLLFALHFGPVLLFFFFSFCSGHLIGVHHLLLSTTLAFGIYDMTWHATCRIASRSILYIYIHRLPFRRSILISTRQGGKGLKWFLSLPGKSISLATININYDLL